MCLIHCSVRHIPVWGKLSGSPNLLQFKRLLNYDEHKLELKSVMWSAPNHINSIQYSYDDSSVIYTYAPWEPLTAKERLPFKIDGKKYPLLRSPNKKIGLADVLMDTGRIKSFKLSDAIIYSYCMDIRFVLFLSIFFGFELWMFIAPDPLLNKPLALCSPP